MVDQKILAVHMTVVYHICGHAYIRKQRKGEGLEMEELPSFAFSCYFTVCQV